MVFLSVAAEDVCVDDQIYIDDLAVNKNLCWANVKRVKRRKVGKDEFRIVIVAGGRNLVCRPADMVLVQRLGL